MTDFIRWLEDEKKKRGITRSAFAAAIGYTEGAVHSWRSGDCRPSEDTCHRLAAFTEVPVEKIIEIGRADSYQGQRKFGDARQEREIDYEAIVLPAVVPATDCNYCGKRVREQSLRRDHCKRLGRVGLPLLCYAWSRMDVMLAGDDLAVARLDPEAEGDED